MPFHVVSYRSFVSEESAANGETCRPDDDRGIVWKADPSLSDEDNASEMVNDVLKRNGACCPSSSHFHPGMWYSTESQPNFTTGEHETESYHLMGASPEVQLLVAREFVRMRLGSLNINAQQGSILGV